MFNLAAYYERATDGTYPEQAALKSQNLPLKIMLEEFIQFKETREFLEAEWKNNPNIPEKLLMLKR
jgi:hypothetical protein